MRSAEELAGCLIMVGLLDENAWYDPDGWDGGIDRDRVGRMIAESRGNAGHEWRDGALVRLSKEGICWRLQYCQCGESREKPDSRHSYDNR